MTQLWPPYLPPLVALQAPPPDASSAPILDRIEAILKETHALLAQGITTREDPVIGQIATASVAVGESLDSFVQLTDVKGDALPFSLLTINQIAIAAPQLVAADLVRLRLYYRGTRQEPADLVAEFDGASQVSGMWAAAFTNRRIEYVDGNKENKVWVRIRNTAGNSGSTTFTIRLYAQRIVYKVL